MAPSTQIVLSMALTLGVPLALALRDLAALRRPPGGGGGWRPEPPSPVPSQPSGGGAPERPALPACLVEAARIPTRARALRVPELV